MSFDTLGRGLQAGELLPGETIEWVDTTLATLLGALRSHQPNFSVAEIVHRVEMDGRVSETRIRLCSPPLEKDAA